MSLHTVTVTTQGRTISVDLDPVKLHPNSTIQWAGNEPFSIEFTDPGPFGRSLSHAQAKQARRPNQGYSGAFKYTITLDRDNSIELDPVVIIDPGPTGK